VTPDKTPEEIEREMLQTRESITEKVAALENQVVGTVQTAADTITNTVEAVKSFVTTAPEAVSDTVKQAAEAVKESFDITGCIRRNPWAAVGTTALFGCLVGWFTAPRRRSLGAPAGYVPATAGAAVERAAAPPSEPPRPSQPGVLDELLGMVGDKVKDLARTAVEAVSGAVKENIRAAVPDLLGGVADQRTNAEPDEPPLAARFDARRAGV
jgi:ElaB/YqjD/DUF883 family membrane-anchored ribosome-binding protein